MRHQHTMKRELCTCLTILLLLVCPWLSAAENSRLPADAAEALRSAEQVEIYSLEPLSRPDSGEFEDLYGYEVLGRALLGVEASRRAVAEFEGVVTAWGDAVSFCFDPRHALRVVHLGATFDFVLCFDCGALEVYRNGKRQTKVAAKGSARALNQLMEEAGLALSQTGYQPPTPEALAREAADLARWMGGMPSSVHALWERTDRFHAGAGLSDDEKAELRAALETEFPDRSDRIRSLFGWFGSGVGAWTGFPAWESVPEQLLLEVPTEELVLAADMARLDSAQREGAARLFAGWDFHNERPNDLQRLPLDLKQALLNHTLSSGEGDQSGRHHGARKAFE